MPLRDEHWITRQGKTYVLLSGLLELAHERGLSSTNVELLDYGLDDAGSFTYAICRTTVELTDSEGTVHRYTGLGDANRENVGKNIAIHLVRMSETRSLARALRVAVNIGTTALEELGGEDSNQQQSSSQQASQSRQRPSPQAQQSGGENVASDSSVNYLKKLLADAGLDTEGWESRSQREVSTKIKELKEGSGGDG